MTEGQQARKAKLEERFVRVEVVDWAPLAEGHVLFVCESAEHSITWFEIAEPVPTQKWCWDTGA
jgi:hypothetical protein